MHSTKVVATSEKIPNWLSYHARNIASQFGEDGIIEKILSMIGVTDHWCVEFGAWDGMHLSNTYNLIKNKSYSAVLIEADHKKFKDLKRNFSKLQDVQCIQYLVGYDNDNNLDTILSNTKIPQNFDVLSIDIDGNDYHVWNAIHFYRPKIIIIEFNPTIPNDIEFVQEKNYKTNHGSSLNALIKLGKIKGYELVATTAVNCIFVEAQYFSLFHIADNSIDQIHKDNSKTTYLFSGYDGTIFLGGNKQMLWHNIPLMSKKIQQLPTFLRDYPENYSWWQKILANIYFKFR